jgi:parallel beta-helix repeat protein
VKILKEIHDDHNKPDKNVSQKSFSRRELLFSLGAAGAALAIGGLPTQTASASPPLPNSTFYNVKDFGANGNGRFTEDDTPSIQSAINTAAISGGIVYIPKGIYFLNAALQIRSNVCIWGSGINASILKTGMNNLNLMSLFSSEYVSIQNLSFEGGNALSSVPTPNVESAIVALNAKAIQISNCKFSNIVNGVRSSNSTKITVEDCQFELITGTAETLLQGYGIWSSGGSDHSYTGNQFNQLFQPCISLNDGSSGAVIANNRMNSCFNAGVELVSTIKDSCQNHLITGNIMKSFKDTSSQIGYACGIRIQGNCSSNRITNNTFYELRDSAIVMKGSADTEFDRPRYNNIENNSIQSMQKHGISLINAYENSISGNEIRSVKGDGIILDIDGTDIGATNKGNSLTGNKIIQAEKAAIRLTSERSSGTFIVGNIGYGNQESVVDKGYETITSTL